MAQLTKLREHDIVNLTNQIRQDYENRKKQIDDYENQMRQNIFIGDGRKIKKIEGFLTLKKFKGNI
jgi:hypothetical protein